MLPFPRRIRWLLSLLPSAFLFAGLGTGPATAELGRWTAFGPGGGTVLSLAVDPTAPDTLYALTAGADFYQDGELYRSSDAGASWTFAGQGLPNRENKCQALALDPAHPATLYFSIGPVVYRSTDGAGSWGPMGSIPDWPYPRNCFLALAPGVAPSTDDPGILFFAFGRRLLRSSDGGTTWSEAFNATADIRALLVNPTAADAVYVATGAGGGGIWRSTDRGQTFSWSGWFDAVDLLAAPAAGPPGLLYAVTSGTLYASIDGGAVWRRRGTIGNVVHALAVDPLSPRTLYAGHDLGASVSHDGGETWELRNQGLPSLDYVHPNEVVVALAGAPGLPGRMYAGTAAAGVYRSDDSGDTWGAGAQQGLAGGYQWLLKFHPADPEILYVEDSAGGLWRSEDGGQSWQRRSEAATRGFLIYSLALDPQAPEVLFAAGTAGVQRSDDGGATWTGLGQGGAGAVFLAGRETLLAYQLGGSAYRSTDGGKTWSSVAGVAWGTIVADPVRGTTFYGVKYASDDLFRSQDGGATWTLLLAGGAGIAVAESRPEILYSGGGGTSPSRLLRSTDNGATWRDVGPMPGNVSNLIVDPHDAETLYCGGPLNSFSRSTDGGAHWTKIENPAGRPWGVRTPIRHPQKPKLYAFPISGTGLFELDLE